MPRRGTTLVHRGELTGVAATTLTATAHSMLYSDAAGDIQELTHGTSGYILTSNGPTSAPSWQAANPLTNFQDNGLSGESLYNSQVATLTHDKGLTVQFPGGGAGTAQLKLVGATGSAASVNLNEGAFTRGQVQYNATSNELRIRTSQTNDNTRMYNDTAGDFILLDGSNTRVELYYNNNAAVRTSSQGLTVSPDNGTTFAAVLYKLNAAKNADTSRAGTTVKSDDPHLVVSVLETGFYSFQAYLRVETTSATPDFKFGFNFSGTASTTSDNWVWFASDSAGVLQNDQHGALTSNAVVAHDGTNPVSIIVSGSVDVTAIGDFSLQWAQNTADATGVELKEGSWIRLERNRDT